jgi:hypothetical protein
MPEITMHDDPINCHDREPVIDRALRMLLRKEGLCEHYVAESAKELYLGLRTLEEPVLDNIHAVAFKVVEEECPRSLVALRKWIWEGGEGSQGVLARLARGDGVQRSTITRQFHVGMMWYVAGLLKAYHAYLHDNGWADVWQRRLGRYFVDCVHQ